MSPRRVRGADVTTCPHCGSEAGLRAVDPRRPKVRKRATHFQRGKMCEGSGEVVDTHAYPQKGTGVPREPRVTRSNESTRCAMELLYEHPGLTRAEVIARSNGLVWEAVRRLIMRGYAVRAATGPRDGQYHLTPAGVEARRKMQGRTKL